MVFRGEQVVKVQVICTLIALTSGGVLLGVGPASAATAGSLDPTFGTGGEVLTSLGGQQPSDAVLQADGDILVGVSGGGAFGVLRYLPNGSLDTAFGSGGYAQFVPASVGGQSPVVVTTRALAAQSNGKIVVVGDVSSLSGQVVDVGAARFNANGSVDTSFGTGGAVTTPVFATSAGFADEVTDTVVIQSNGDILLGTSASQVSHHSEVTTGAVLRYTSAGVLDSTFGSGGVVVSAGLGDVRTLGLDASGDVFVLPGAVELSSAGQFDPSVTAEPIVASSPGGSYAFLSDGQYVTATSVGAGKHNDEVEAERFDAGGAVDPTFDSVLLHYSGTGASEDSAGAIAVSAGGRIVYGGSQFLATSVFGVAEVDANGAVDTAFGTNGALTTDFRGDDSVTALLIQPNGDIVAVGSSEDNSTGQVDIALARYVG
jgi:uncharacterized delta-60 repeat protein